MSWNILLLLLYLKFICRICHGKIGRTSVLVPVSRVNAILDRDRHVTCFNALTSHTTAVKQVTIVVHCATCTSKGIQQCVVPH